MRRWFLTVSAVVLTALAVSSFATTRAQEAGSGDLANHPVVGAWLADTDVDDPANPSSLLVFHDDGTFFQSGAEGIGVGAWEATDGQTAALTILFQNVDEEGNVATVKVRVTVEVAADGNSFTAPYTLEFIGPDGTSSGEQGPATASATRIMVEPMGTPVGPASDTAGGEEGAPETAATPAG